jgi:hypothetical protein
VTAGQGSERGSVGHRRARAAVAAAVARWLREAGLEAEAVLAPHLTLEQRAYLALAEG